MSIILDRSTVYVDNFNIHRIHPVTEVRQKRTKVEAMRPNNHELPSYTLQAQTISPLTPNKPMVIFVLHSVNLKYNYIVLLKI